MVPFWLKNYSSVFFKFSNREARTPAQEKVQNGTTIGVARIFDWGGPNNKSHLMTSSEILKRGTFCGSKISEMGQSGRLEGEA